MLRLAALAALLSATSVLADTAGPQCSLDKKCPKESPCCSQYGQCGVGAVCLGGCDPRMSFSLDSCVPAPICQSRTTKFSSIDSLAKIEDFLGDESKAEWVYQGEPKEYKGDMLLTMAKGTAGTVVASSTYMWYGNVKATLKTSRGKGVVTAFILLSDVKDEIDYEFVGVDLETAQTNYYFQGIPNYHHSGNITVTDSFDNFHEYEIDWTPDKVEWLVDGKSYRTVNRKDTWNSTSNQWEFPQTPARVQLSIWPAGDPKNAKGTIDWAGGTIDWDSGDAKDYGYYFTTFSEVAIKCYDTKTAPGTNNGKSYYYNNAKGTNDTVVDSNKSPIIASLQATGLDPTKGDSDSGGSVSIPGGDSGSTGQNHAGDSQSKGGSTGGGDQTPGHSPPPANCDVKTFNQDCSSNNKAAGSSSGSGDKNDGVRAAASPLAIIVAGCALYWL